METITISKEEFERMQKAIKILRNLEIYKRLLEFEENITKDKKYTRGDLGF